MSKDCLLHTREMTPEEIESMKQPGSGYVFTENASGVQIAIGFCSECQAQTIWIKTDHGTQVNGTVDWAN